MLMDTKGRVRGDLFCFFEDTVIAAGDGQQSRMPFLGGAVSQQVSSSVQVKGSDERNLRF